jgi:hypothetical protein
VTDDNFLAGLIMYGAYAVLFLAFAVGKYCSKATSSAVTDKAVKKKA